MQRYREGRCARHQSAMVKMSAVAVTLVWTHRSSALRDCIDPQFFGSICLGSCAHKFCREKLELPLPSPPIDHPHLSGTGQAPGREKNLTCRLLAHQ